MEKVLSNGEKIKKAEEIYYKRKMGIPSAKFSKLEGDKKSYLGSKIFLELLLIINFSIIIMGIQNKDYIFTKEFLSDIQKYNINITQSIKDFIGNVSDGENIYENQDLNSNVQDQNSNIQELDSTSQNNNQEQVNELLQTETPIPTQTTDEIVPNEEQSSSLNQMENTISKIMQLVEIQKPINEGVVTSRFGSRSSVYKNVTGYHTGIDIGATKRYINLFCNVTES